jgi:hypothetical protein
VGVYFAESASLFGGLDIAIGVRATAPPTAVPPVAHVPFVNSAGEQMKKLIVPVGKRVDPVPVTTA